MDLSIEMLEAMAREIIGNRDLALTREMTTQDVPGWDSLNHTLITIEIAERTGRAVDARQLGQASNFGNLVDLVNATPV